MSTTRLQDAGWPTEMMNVLNGGMPTAARPPYSQYHYAPPPPAVMVPNASPPPPPGLSNVEIGLITMNVALFVLVLILFGIISVQNQTMFTMLQKFMGR